MKSPLTLVSLSLVAAILVAVAMLTLTMRPVDPFAGAQAPRVKVKSVSSSLDQPTAVAVLPDHRLLVAERGGRLRLVGVNGGVSAPLAGLDERSAAVIATVFDIIVDRNFAQSRALFLCYLARAGAVTIARLTLDSAELPHLQQVHELLHRDGLHPANCRLAQHADFGLTAIIDTNDGRSELLRLAPDTSAREVAPRA